MNPRKPFPQHVTYTSGTILPNGVTQPQMDTAVGSFYEEWKSRYLKATDNCQYYVYYNYDLQLDPAIVSCSEGHGYGLIFTALMAGYDPSAQAYFDGLYRYYQAHPSVNNPRLMAWQQAIADGNHFDSGNSSATDGDLDIAYALILADNQWGSTGEINYREAARSICNAIMQNDVNRQNWTLTLGDWVSPASVQYNDCRSSDFILHSMKVFSKVTGDSNWDNLISKTYAIINGLYNDFSINTGLIPDFIVLLNQTYYPADGDYLESAHDGKYSYNACRFPLRSSLDYLLTGDTAVLPQLNKLNDWIRISTLDNPTGIKAGYNLSGAALSDYTDLCFVAPFGVSAMVNSSNQNWLNAIWTYCVENPINDGTYYDNSLKLMSMIIMSGNWWSPL